MSWRKEVVVLFTAVLIAACGRPGNDLKEEENGPAIFPDYTDVAVPLNIAPLNFKLSGGSNRISVTIEGQQEKFTVSGKGRINIPPKKWSSLLKNNSDGTISVSVFERLNNKWIKYKPFFIYVKADPVDPWIVYRLIAPGYEAWSEMGIYQRNLTTFKQEPIINNRLLPGACMNCHSFNSNNPDEMMFHLRGTVGGTVLVQNSNIKILNTKSKETISNCVYPYWHPSGNYIAFSVNNIQQVFHSEKEKRIEVFDSRSDIVIYDIRNNKLTTSKIISSEESFETFPAFTPDGKSLIFCSAEKRPQPDDYNKIRYSLCKIDFDASTGNFGERIDTLVSAFQTGKSVSFPRVSPNGRSLVFTLSDYGNFSIWHREADLYQLDLATGIFSPLDVINSPETESYHSWSSNSRWLIFSSRRTDGLYTRPYIAYFNEDGTFRKPFMVPQKNPDFYDELLRSFNVPEFVTGKVKKDGRDMLKSIGSPAKDVNFERKD